MRLLLQFLRISPIQHRRVEFSRMIVFRYFIGLQYVCKLCIEGINVKLLQALRVISKVARLYKSLVPLELFHFEGIEQLL